MENTCCLRFRVRVQWRASGSKCESPNCPTFSLSALPTRKLTATSDAQLLSINAQELVKACLHAFLIVQYYLFLLL